MPIPRVGDIYKVTTDEWRQLCDQCYVPNSRGYIQPPMLLCSRIAGCLKGEVLCDFLLIAKRRNGSLMRGLAITSHPIGTLIKHLRKPSFIKLSKGESINVKLKPTKGVLSRADIAHLFEQDTEEWLGDTTPESNYDE